MEKIIKVNNQMLYHIFLLVSIMRFYKIIGFASIVCISFMYVEKISNFVIYKSDLYQNIESVKNDYYIKAVNAEIDGDYITPGLYGHEVDVLNSYYKMKKFNQFNNNYLSFLDVIPDVSLKDNKDKIIKNGNKNKNEISFIIDNEDIKKYFINNNIKGDILITYEEFNKDSNLEQINNDYINYKRLENIFKKNKKESSLCLYSGNIKDICKKNNKYLIKTDYVLKANNIASIKNSIKPGLIIYIDKDVSIDSFKIIHKKIIFKGINIVYLSELISESN